VAFRGALLKLIGPGLGFPYFDRACRPVDRLQEDWTWRFRKHSLQHASVVEDRFADDGGLGSFEHKWESDASRDVLSMWLRAFAAKRDLCGSDKTCILTLYKK
jgi:hypothetical protein